MCNESIGSCGNSQTGRDPRERFVFELDLGIQLLRAVCGNEPAGSELRITWCDHELGQYAVISLSSSAEVLDEKQQDYQILCEDVLAELDGALDWDILWEQKEVSLRRMDAQDAERQLEQDEED